MLTNYLLPEATQRHGRVGFNKHLYQNDAIVMPGTDRLHETCRPKSLLVDKIGKFWDLDARSAGRRRCHGEALPHRRKDERRGAARRVEGSLANKSYRNL